MVSKDAERRSIRRRSKGDKAVERLIVIITTSHNIDFATLYRAKYGYIPLLRQPFFSWLNMLYVMLVASLYLYIFYNSLLYYVCLLFLSYLLRSSHFLYS